MLVDYNYKKANTVEDYYCLLFERTKQLEVALDINLAISLKKKYNDTKNNLEFDYISSTYNH